MKHYNKVEVIKVDIDPCHHTVRRTNKDFADRNCCTQVFKNHKKYDRKRSKADTRRVAKQYI